MAQSAARQRAAEVALDSLQQQMAELCRSETLARTRKQHDRDLAAMREQHEARMLALQQRLDAQTQALEQQVRSPPQPAGVAVSGVWIPAVWLCAITYSVSYCPKRHLSEKWRAGSVGAEHLARGPNRFDYSVDYGV